MLEGFILVHQVIVDLLHASLEEVSVLEKRAIERGPCNIKDFWLYLPLLLNIMQQNVSFP
jgi:hypothetical protein